MTAGPCLAPTVWSRAGRGTGGHRGALGHGRRRPAQEGCEPGILRSTRLYPTGPTVIGGPLAHARPGRS